MKASFAEIPIVDLGPWFCHPARRYEIAQTVKTVCRDVGFIYLKNHGVSQPVIDNAFKEAVRFFAQPQPAKLKLHYRQTGGHRGYLPMESESTDPNAKPDVKEAFDCGLVLPPSEINLPRMTAPNLWPDNLPEFKKAVQEYFDSVWELARTMFRIFALSFEMREDFFDDKVNQPIATLRLLHYPPQAPQKSVENLGIGAHCDYECFTILAQDAIGGLQAQNTKGEWIDVPPIPGTLVINIGEMLSRWTNDLFVATPHRVINSTGRERYSLAFFFATNNETVIECLSSCVAEDNPPKYPPIAAGKYLAGRLREIYGV